MHQKSEVPNIGLRAEVEAFLRSQTFSGYQAMPLPHGLSVPGADLSARAEHILDGRVAGKTVLDIGTYYGFFAYEATRRGATGAIGLEANAERARIAAKIAHLHGSRYAIVHSSFEEYVPADRFDIVLFLRVLHHVDDPVRSIRHLVKLCRGTVIVEFALADDPQYMRDLDRSPRSARVRGLRARARAWLLGRIAGDLPLAAIGDRAYHRTFYFSRTGFRNLFMIHQPVFSSVEFLDSSSKRRHAVALCTVKE